ncbi:2,3-bisphosphoglycerate-dependent phosphoglycerate mutase [Alphaproteobacteria bacterium]|nr:2,3-bisphosphoglycerate-dependent phosphoglycerate mutase [Alphaproteobacteria bacterium]
MNSLILLRHGQSQWNLENRFTGWKDVPLTEKGIEEANKAGLLIKESKIKIDIVFSSILQRANRTAELALKENDFAHLWKDNQLIMTKSQNLNERDYGDLVGLNKEETSQKFGKDQVHIWRRSYDVSPPGGESLKNVVDRVEPYFEKFIQPHLFGDKNVIIVAHGNSLRATMIKIGLYKPEEISKIELPTGSPFVINFSSGKLQDANYLN